MTEESEIREAAKSRLMQMEHSILEETARQLGCVESSLLVSKEDLVEKIIQSPKFRADYHLAPVSTLEWLVQEDAPRKRLEDRYEKHYTEYKEKLDARFEENVKPLRRINQLWLSMFATVGTVATVLIGVSTLSGFNLNEQLKESRGRLEEDLRDLERVRDELRRERRDQQRQWARLHHFYLKGEITDFRKAFENILYVSLEQGSEELKSILNDEGSDIEQWNDLVKAADTAPLETRRDLKIIEIQIEFIKAVRQFAEWKEHEVPEEWSVTQEKWAGLQTTLLALQPEHLRNIHGQKFLYEPVKDSNIADIKSFEEMVDDKNQGDGIIPQNKIPVSRAGHREKEDVLRLFRKALAYTCIILSQLERLSPPFEEDLLDKAINYAQQAIFFDSSNAQAYSELSRNYRKKGDRSDTLEDKTRYYEKAARVLKYASRRRFIGGRFASKDELILKNNLAYLYMKWAQKSKNEIVASEYIKKGLDSLSGIKKDRFNATGTIQEFALITRAELEIFDLLIEIEGFDEVKAAWEGKTCLEPSEKLIENYNNFFDKDKQVNQASYEALSRSPAYQLTKKIYNDLADTKDFGKSFFREKHEKELQSKSPQLCAFAKLIKKSSDLSRLKTTQQRIEQLQEQDLHRLLGDIRDLFQLKEAEHNKSRTN